MSINQGVSIEQQTNIYHISPHSYEAFLSVDENLVESSINMELKPIGFEISIEVGNATRIQSEILVLKFANRFYGADYEVAKAINLTEEVLLNKMLLKKNYALLPSQELIASPYILFLQVGELYEFGYDQIRQFAMDSLQILAQIAPGVEHIAMTIHGIGYGLDEYESLRAQIAGYFDAYTRKEYPSHLKRITIIERNANRAKRIRTILSLGCDQNM